MEKQRGLCSFTPAESASCGAGVSPGPPAMRLSITSTTGSPVELTVPRGETVDGLRKQISHKLRLQTDRIVLLYRDKQLTAGSLLDLGVTDGSKLTLVPAIEAGLVCSTARAERTMMDVLESLTEVQISDFLSGRSPLTINLGIGAHMMYVQLQLSAQNVAELQHHRDLRAESNSRLQTGRTSSPDSPNATESSAPPASPTPTPTQTSSDSTSSIKASAQRPRTSFNSKPPASQSPTAMTSPPYSMHTSSPVIPPSLPSGCPRPTCPLPANTPVCSPAPTGSIPGPQSPAPASTFKESDASSTAELCKQPGAVIESFVSHSPGVFSGTFSGTLAPCSQSGISHPRRGISIILQILNDLLRAAYHHQGPQPAPPHPHRCPESTPATAEEPSKAKSKTLVGPRPEHLTETPGEASQPISAPTLENQTLHCKLERLQFLMHQRRLRRRTRRNSQASHPYQHRHHRP